MSWLAILLALASLGGDPAPRVRSSTRKQCTAAKHGGQAGKPARCQEKPQGEAEAAGQAHEAGAEHAGRAARPRRAARARGRPAPAPGARPRRPRHADARADRHARAAVTYPSRTGVDLDEWVVRPSYRTLAAGRIEFNVANLGEDDHNLSVRGGGKEYGRIDLAPGESDTLTLDLWPGPTRSTARCRATRKPA